MAHTITFYKTSNGREPAREWIQDLAAPKRASMVAAIREILTQQGIDVCGTPFGKHLGEGLAEFRVREDAITLRLFFHAHGVKQILLLSGFDKGRFGGGRRQAKAIAQARKFLADFKRS